MFSFADFGRSASPLSAPALRSAAGPEEALLLVGEALEAARKAGSVEREAAALVASGEASAWSGDHGAAVARAGEALKLCESLGEQRGQGCAFYLLASSRLAQGQDALSLKAASQAAALFKGLGDKAWETASLEAVAATLVTKEGHIARNRTVEVLRELGRRRASAALTRATADALLAKGEREAAVKLASEALFVERSSVWSSAGNMAMLPPAIAVPAKARRAAIDLLRASMPMFSKDKGKHAKVLLAVAAAELADGHTEEALKTSEEARALFKTAKDAKGEVLSLCVLSAARLPQPGSANKVCDATQALKLAEDAIATSRAAGGVAEVDALASLAVALLHRQGKGASANKEEAQRAAQEAVSVAKRLGDRHMESEAVAATLYVQLSTTSKAAHEEVAKTCRQLSGLCRDTGDQSGEAVSLEIAAYASILVRQDKDAVRASKDAASLHKRLEDKDGESGAEATLLSSCFVRRDFDQALQIAKAFAASSRQAGDKLGEAVATVIMACASLANDEPLLVLKAAEEALALSAGLGGLTAFGAHCLLHHAHRASGKPVSAQKAANELLAAIGSKTAGDAIPGSESEAWALLLAADAQSSGKDALQGAQDAVALFKQFDNEAAVAFGTLGVARAQLGQEGTSIEEGIKSAHAARAAFKSHGLVAGEAIALITTAKGLFLQDDISGAEKAGRDALTLFQDLGDAVGAAFVSNLISKVLSVPRTLASARLVLDKDNGCAHIEISESVSSDSIEQTLTGLQKAQIETSGAIKVIVIHLEGAPSATPLQGYAGTIGALMLALRIVGLPLVVACWGRIAGPHWGLLLAADYRIAANTTTFMLPIWGLPETMGDLAGHNVATLLNCETGPVGALRMLETGIVHQCQRGRDEVRQAASEIAKRIAGTPGMACRQSMNLLSPAVEKYAIAAATGLIRT